MAVVATVAQQFDDDDQLVVLIESIESSEVDETIQNTIDAYRAQEQAANQLDPMEYEEISSSSKSFLF